MGGAGDGGKERGERRWKKVIVEGGRRGKSGEDLPREGAAARGGGRSAARGEREQKHNAMLRTRRRALSV